MDAEPARRHLDRLSDALRNVREPLRGEIWTGVAEELDGLSDSDARGRIAELGEPTFIAREARNAADVGAAPVTTSTGYTTVVIERPPLTSKRGWAIAGAIALGVGGFVVPFVGWLIGVALVTASTMWTRREKSVAVVAPLAVVVVAAFVTHWIGADRGSDASANPLVPAFYDFAWTGIVGAALLNVVAMVWLLVRMGRR